MSLINNIISTIKYETYEIAQNRIYRTTLLLLPLATILFFGAMFYKGSIENLPIVIIDNDNSTSSRKLLEMIEATRGVKIEYYATSTIEAENLLKEGNAYALLLIPSGLERNIYSNICTPIECYISGTNLSASGIIESDIQSSVQTFASGIELTKLQSKGLARYQAIQEIMPINFLTHIISNPYINYGYYLAPIFMFMALAIFTTTLTTYALGRELYYATAPKLISVAGNNIAAAIIGKLLPTTLVMTIFSQLIYFVIFIIMGMECQGSYLMLTIGSIIFIIAYQSVALFITTITANMRLALSLGGGYAVMAFTFSGITFPTSSMFGIAQLLSNFFPLTWFCDIFIDQAMRGAPIIYSIKPLLTTLLFTLLPITIVCRLHKVLLNSKYWSRD
jgi:ABC-2 type transport system permease protein